MNDNQHLTWLYEEQASRTRSRDALNRDIERTANEIRDLELKILKDESNDRNNNKTQQ